MGVLINQLTAGLGGEEIAPAGWDNELLVAQMVAAARAG